MIKKSIYYFSKYKESVCRTFSRPSGVIYDQFPIAEQRVRLSDFFAPERCRLRLISSPRGVLP